MKIFKATWRRNLFLGGLLIFLFAWLFLNKVIFILPEAKLIFEIIGGVALIISIVTELHIRRIEKQIEKGKKEEEERLGRIEEQVERANKNIEKIERHIGVPIYADGLPSADPPVFDPFFEGTKLMTAYKWDEAISEFQKAMKEAKASQLVALYNLIALCYYTSGRQALALENIQKSLSFAEQFVDKEGKANALGNIGLIYRAKGDLDQALKYLQEALKIDKEIGLREGEASDLGNIGLIYQDRGDLDQALKYHREALKIHKEVGYRGGEASALGNIGVIYQAKGDLDQALKYQKEALKIDKEIGFREGEATALNNIGLAYETKGNLEQALKYYNEALKIFEEIGMPKEIGIVKGNIERVSQQMKQMKK